MLNPFTSFGIYIAEMLIAYLYFPAFWSRGDRRGSVCCSAVCASPGRRR